MRWNKWAPLRWDPQGLGATQILNKVNQAGIVPVVIVLELCKQFQIRFVAINLDIENEQCVIKGKTYLGTVNMMYK